MMRNKIEEDGNRTVAINNRLRPKRKFPGPAGILPDLRNDDDVRNLNVANNRLAQRVSQIICNATKSSNSSLDPTTSSQGEKDQGLLARLPWNEIQQRLALNGNDDDCPMKCMNIQWILDKAHKMPVAAKIPFLVAVVQETPELPRSKPGQEKPSKIKLLDRTGTIEAAIDPAFVRRYSKDLVPGTALALENAGLFLVKRRIVLTITSKNVIYMAADSARDPVDRADGEDREQKSPSNSPVTESGVKIWEFKKFSRERAMEAYKRISDPAITRQRLSTGRSKSSRNEKQLFATVGGEFDDEDDELFLGLDTEFWDDTCGSDGDSRHNCDVMDVESENISVDSRSETRDVVTNVMNNLDEEFEDEFDRDLAGLDDEAVQILTQTNESNYSNSAMKSIDHFDRQGDDGAESKMMGVKVNAVPEDVDSGFYSNKNTLMTPVVSSSSLRNSQNIFESSQPTEEVQADETAEAMESEHCDLSTQKKEDDNNEDDFILEFDQELDSLDV